MSEQLRGRKYSGDLWAKKYGSNDNWERIGNVTQLEIERKVESDELQSTGKNDYGAALESVPKPGVTSIKTTFNTFDKHGLARILMGTAVDFTGTVQNVVDKVLTVKKGGSLELEHGDIDPATLAVKTEAGQAVEASNYRLTANLGLLEILPASTLNNGDKIKVSYKTKGRAGFHIDAETVSDIELELKLDGKDRITGKEGLLHIYHAKLKTDGALDWFADDWWKNGVTGTLLKPSDKPSTYSFREFA